MICKKCKEQGLKSEIYNSGGGMTTLMGYSTYYDEDGNFHSHDPNRSGESYKCSNGHEFSVSSLSKCPSCNYGGEKDNIIHYYE